MSRRLTNTRPPIAVVGVSALFPGSINATGFWSDILAGTDRLTPVPSTHWLIDDYFDPDPAAVDKTYGRRGGFLSTVGLDPLAFGIPPALVPSTDTAQLLGLVVAQQVLDDATRTQFADLDRSRVSVILGATGGQELLGAMASRLSRPLWLQGMRRAGVPEDVALAACEQIANLHPSWTESTFPGLLGNVIAGRIANRLDLGGTNCVTDAACASSFSAISMGVNELYLGDSDLVISGGVDTMNDILMFTCFSKTPALSRTEDVRPFAENADGTMLGEGIGMVALKRLEDAERDGNSIYCVINGVGSSSDGRAKSVYAPVAEGQSRAIAAAYAKAGYGPETVELVEAHGTGTVAGDAAEFAGLTAVFDECGRDDRQWCALGSVKSQIGHTKAAAGAAGLIKAIMAVHHAVLPPTAKIDRPNPELDLPNSPFYLNGRSRPWVRGSDHVRRGSISSFGFGGSNFHVTLSEYDGVGRRAPRLRVADAELVVLVGDDADEVIRQAREHTGAHIDAERLAWLAQTSQRAYRPEAPARLGIVVTDGADLSRKLELAVERILAAPTASFTAPGGIAYGWGEPTDSLAFVFPGQGSQYAFMGESLAMTYRTAIGAWDVAADVVREPRALHDVVFPISTFEPDAEAAADALLTATEWAQPALAVTSLAMLRMLRALGLEPKFAAGHSFGEVLALHAAGVLSETDTIRVARRRGELMAQAADVPGSMLAVSASLEVIRPIVANSGTAVVVANHNTYSQVVLSGTTTDIVLVEKQLSEQGLACKRLSVATAFHSPVVSGAGEAFAEFLGTVEVKPPTIPVYANETAEPYPTALDALREQLGRQLTRPVRFVELIESMYAGGARTFVEVGPSAVLSGLIGSILDGRDHCVVAMDAKRKGGLAPFLGGIAQLVAAGASLSLDALWADYGDMPNPDEREVPKMSIPISGTNHGKPYPPLDLAELAPPNPSSTVRADPTAVVVTAARVDGPPAAPTESVADVERVAPAPAMTTPQLSAEVMIAFQAAQQQTAETHAVFLNSMAQAHSAFLNATQLSLYGAGSSVDVQVPTIGIAAPIAPHAEASAPVAAVSVAPVPVAPVPEMSVPVLSVPVVDVSLVLLAVIAETTGYPVEFLELGMELESDLGVDSIRRVEILSAMQDRLPGLPDADVAVLAGLVTIGEIVDHLSGLLGIAAAPTLTPTPTALAAAVSVPVVDVPVVDVSLVLLAVIAETTGYPVEFLELGMELESDLGVDSIRRVEILSAMQDRLPGLPDADVAVLAGLVTIGQIVDHLSGLLGVAAVVPLAPVPMATVPELSVPVPMVDVSSVDVSLVLLAVIAETTGYPVEFLELGMELESDLGVDSIRRVEILSAMQDRLPGLPDEDVAVLAGLVTIGEIVDHLSGLLGIAATPTPGLPAPERAPQDRSASSTRFVVRATHAPRLGTSTVGPADGRIAVTDDGRGIGSALVDLLVADGINAELVATTPEGYDGVIFLGGLRRLGTIDDAVAVNAEAFRTARAAGSSNRVFVTVTDLGGMFGDGGVKRLQAWTAGVTALARTAAIEWPSSRVKAIDVELGEQRPSEVARVLADELRHGGPELEVGRRADGSRFTLETTPAEGAVGPLVLGPTDVIVVSGGARGITAASIVELARATKARFVLLGRTSPVEESAEWRDVHDDPSLKRVLIAAAKASGREVGPAELGEQVREILASREINDTIERIGAVGGEAQYVAVDITNSSAVRTALDDVRSALGPITAVIHGAGVVADRRIVDKTDAQFDAVFNTKVAGLRALLDATSDDPLKLLCLFSSVASRAGNDGQSDYAMANEVLNKVAIAERARRASDCVVKSCLWGPWAGGMVTTALQARFESMGVPVLDPELGARLFVEELASLHTDQVEVILGHSPSLAVAAVSVAASSL